MTRPWLTVNRGDAPIIVSFPHTGTHLPAEYEGRFGSPWLARKDADWWIDRLYAFVAERGATTVHTSISRSIIDVNRDPLGATLYPGQATTELCPTTTFDGEGLYAAGAELQTWEIAERRSLYFDPYHSALAGEIERLRAGHPVVVLYDCHSIRSIVPRLFKGELPVFNIGTNDGRSCDSALTAAVDAICARTTFSRAVNGRFKGGWITRRYGQTLRGVHAIQMELACRGYMHEQLGAVTPDNWPTPYDDSYAAAVRQPLIEIIDACLAFARQAS